ncbi:MAG TPA: hypothetical protein VFV08_06260 [Puia sp.]|nr:hypothetical protein [Puia sp.]
MKTILFYILSPFFLLACHSRLSSNSNSDTSQKISYPSDNVPEFRKEIKSKPVAEYKIRTDDPLNDFYFTVKLYETNRTFDYKLEFQFEEVRGEDTIRFPNFGFSPAPGLQKGDGEYSCIIGFYDKDQKFRTYKKVFVKDGREVKIVTLNRYSVVTEDASK